MTVATRGRRRGMMAATVRADRRPVPTPVPRRPA